MPIPLPEAVQPPDLDGEETNPCSGLIPASSREAVLAQPGPRPRHSHQAKTCQAIGQVVCALAHNQRGETVLPSGRLGKHPKHQTETVQKGQLWHMTAPKKGSPAVGKELRPSLGTPDRALGQWHWAVSRGLWGVLQLLTPSGPSCS